MSCFNKHFATMLLEYRSEGGGEANVHILVTGFTSKLNDLDWELYNLVHFDVPAEVLFTFDNEHHPLVTNENRGTFKPYFMHKFSETEHSDQELQDLMYNVLTQEELLTECVGAVCFETLDTKVELYEIVNDLSGPDLKYCNNLTMTSLHRIACYSDPKWGSIHVSYFACH